VVREGILHELHSRRGATHGTLFPVVLHDLVPAVSVLSITHKFHSDHDSKLYVGKPRHASPDDDGARCRVMGPSEIAA
jgi:hypothetical protein